MKSGINDKEQIIDICAVCISYELGEISAVGAMERIKNILTKEE